MYCAEPQPWSLGTATYNLLGSFYRCVIRHRPKYGQRHAPPKVIKCNSWDRSQYGGDGMEEETLHLPPDAVS